MNFILQVKLFDLAVKRPLRNAQLFGSGLAAALVFFQCLFDHLNFLLLQAQHFFFLNRLGKFVIVVGLRKRWRIGLRRLDDGRLRRFGQVAFWSACAYFGNQVLVVGLNLVGAVLLMFECQFL